MRPRIRGRIYSQVNLLHRGSVNAGEPYREVLTAHDLQQGRLLAGAQSLVVTHEDDGTFLAVPVGADGAALE
jgi:hypothetical protein